MKVKFSSHEEFLEEFKRDGPPSKILRLTRSYRRNPQLPIASVSVVATFVNQRGECVELTRQVGEDWGTGGPKDEKMDQLITLVMGNIEQTAKEAGVEVRAGRFDDQ